MAYLRDLPTCACGKPARKELVNRTVKKPNDFEQQVLDVCLVELRRAMKIKAQLSIVCPPTGEPRIDDIFAGPNEQGVTYEIAARPKRRGTASK